MSSKILLVWREGENTQRTLSFGCTHTHTGIFTNAGASLVFPGELEWEEGECGMGISLEACMMDTEVDQVHFSLGSVSHRDHRLDYRCVAFTYLHYFK